MNQGYPSAVGTLENLLPGAKWDPEYRRMLDEWEVLLMETRTRVGSGNLLLGIFLGGSVTESNSLQK